MIIRKLLQFIKEITGCFAFKMFTEGICSNAEKSRNLNSCNRIQNSKRTSLTARKSGIRCINIIIHQTQRNRIFSVFFILKLINGFLCQKILIDKHTKIEDFLILGIITRLN